MPTTRPEAPALRHVMVSDVMSPGIISCPADSPVAAVASIMSANRIHCVVVPDIDDGDGDRRWGVVSDVELVVAGMADFDGLRARDVAAVEPLTVPEWESLQRACQLMVEHGLTHLLVVGRASWPVGVLSSLDVARAMARAAPAARPGTEGG